MFSNAEQNDNIQNMSDLSKGVHNVTSTKEIETPYGKSYILRLDDDNAVFANSKINKYIEQTKLSSFQFEHQGMSSFTKNNNTVNYAKVQPISLEVV